VPSARKPETSTPNNIGIAEGAGVGFGIDDFRVTQSSRGSGRTRLFHVFNPSPKDRQKVADFVIWDWDGDLKRLACTDAQGRPARHQVIDGGGHTYWGHQYLHLLVEVARLVSVVRGSLRQLVTGEGVLDLSGTAC
jgi:hypothetical protein